MQASAPAGTTVQVVQAADDRAAPAGPALAPEPLMARFQFKEGRGLRQQTARGTIVNAAFQVGLSALGLIKGFVVAALLTASDYGIWGILVIAMGTLLWLRQVGVGDKYIQQSESDQELAFQKAFTLELLVCGIFTALLVLAVPVIALVYGHQELLVPGFLLTLMVPLMAFQSPLWIFYRRMDFVRQRSLQAVDPIVGFVVTLGLALAGAGYWSLVIGVVAGSLAGAVVAVTASPYRLALRYDRGTLRSYSSFSWPLFVAAAASLVIAQGSVLAGELATGLAGVGAIALAATIVQFNERVDGIITGTMYPAICAVRDRAELLYEAFVKSNRLALMWGIPFGVALALFAGDLVAFGIGEEWRPALLLLQIFGINAALYHIGFNWDAFYRAAGNTRPMAVVSVVTMLGFLAAPVPLIFTNGLDGFAVGMAIATVVTLVARTVYLVKLFPAFDMARHAARAIAPTLPALGLVLLLRLVGDLDRTLALALAELALFVGVTAAATFVFERSLLREVIGYLRRVPSSPQAAAT